MEETFFKPGEIVVVRKFNNSFFNIYKGYISEIIKCTQNSVLIAIGTYTGTKYYNIPIEHVIHVESSINYNNTQE